MYLTWMSNKNFGIITHANSNYEEHYDLLTSILTFACLEVSKKSKYMKLKCAELLIFIVF